MNQARTPQLQILADGTPLPGVLAASVSGNNHYGASLWTARLALTADPLGLAAWDARTGALIDIQVSLGGDGWTSLVTGTLDSLSADAIGGEITIEGRDLSSGLIEARTQESFANQTASDVAALLAGRHGPTPQVSPTTTLIGRYYGADHDRVTLSRHARASTEWDLLVLLAEQEGFDLFVAGTTLYFQPPVPDAPPAMILQPLADGALPANLSALRLRRRMTLAGDLSVTVKSWNTQQQTAFSQTATRTSGAGVAADYAYVRPNLTPDEALLLAGRKLEAIARHELVMDATMPGEFTLTPRDTVQLTGTGSVFDATYVIDQIARRLSLREGFVETLRAHIPPVITTSGDDTDTF